MARHMTWRLWTIIENPMARTTRLLDPIHPDEILSEEFMKPLGISINRLSRDLNVPPNRIHGIVHGRHRAPPRNAFRGVAVSPKYRPPYLLIALNSPTRRGISPRSMSR
jgi:addiction module HigA family antidote